MHLQVRLGEMIGAEASQAKSTNKRFGRGGLVKGEVTFEGDSHFQPVLRRFNRKKGITESTVPSLVRLAGVDEAFKLLVVVIW